MQSRQASTVRHTPFGTDGPPMVTGAMLLLPWRRTLGSFTLSRFLCGSRLPPRTALTTANIAADAPTGDPNRRARPSGGYGLTCTADARRSCAPPRICATFAHHRQSAVDLTAPPPRPSDATKSCLLISPKLRV